MVHSAFRPLNVFVVLRHHLFRVDHICAHGRMKDRVAFLQSGDNPPFLFIVNIQVDCCAFAVVTRVWSFMARAGPLLAPGFPFGIAHPRYVWYLTVWWSWLLTRCGGSLNRYLGLVPFAVFTAVAFFRSVIIVILFFQSCWLVCSFAPCFCPVTVRCFVCSDGNLAHDCRCRAVCCFNPSLFTPVASGRVLDLWSCRRCRGTGLTAWCCAGGCGSRRPRRPRLPVGCRKRTGTFSDFSPGESQARV